MQRLDSADPQFAAIEGSLHELEALCAEIERSLMRRQWEALEAAIADSRRVTHALQNAMDEARALRTQAFDENIFRRLRHVQAIRENQMTRLQQYHDAVGERLRLIARWKSALRSIPVKRASSALSALNEVR